jgi:hypothetical protein
MWNAIKFEEVSGREQAFGLRAATRALPNSERRLGPACIRMPIYGIFNRNTHLLESRVTHRKQTTAIRSNRNKIRPPALRATLHSSPHPKIGRALTSARDTRSSSSTLLPGQRKPGLERIIARSIN